jgi:hypothetical protein
MAALHPDMFRPSTVDESELIKLVDSHLLPSHVVLQWWSTKDEDIPMPHTNEIVVSMAFSSADSTFQLAIYFAAYSTIT